MVLWLTELKYLDVTASIIIKPSFKELSLFLTTVSLALIHFYSIF